MEQLGSHWTDFSEIWSLTTLQKPVEKLKTFIKSDKNPVRYMETYVYLWSYLLKMRNVAEKFAEKSNNSYYFQNFCENRAIYEIMWDNKLQPDRPQMAI